MYNYQLHLHFVGIGGVGMAGIAEVLLNLGYSVSGSDVKENPLIGALERLGAKVRIGHHENNLPEGTRVVVVSSAIAADNPELAAAQRAGIPVIARAEMLAELMRMKYGIAIAGSHGKTTTTSMTARILSESGLDPTIIVGGRVLNAATGARLGMGSYLVAEADESDGSFCMLRPAIAVVTNIGREHLSHYGSFGALEEAFHEFMASVPFYGLVVGCGDDPVVMKLLDRTARRSVVYGLSPEHEICASHIAMDGPYSQYRLHVQGEEVGEVRLPMSGLHMVSNSLAAIAVGLELGVYVDEAVKALETFPGVARRTEVVGNHRGVLVLDDYAHHPTEIAATLAALRRAWLPFHARKTGASDGRLIVLFEPHRYSRTKDLFLDFLRIFGEADRVIIGEIYSAGEEPIPGVTGESLARAIQHPDVLFVPELKSYVYDLADELRRGDLVAFLGAGSVGRTARVLGELLEAR